MTNPPDWKQDQDETSRLPRKGTESAQTMLAPCPFCGKADIERNSDKWGHWFFCDCGARSGYGHDPAEAAWLWNTRAASAPAAVREETKDDVLSVLYTYRDHEPEEDESWESWYYAAFDLACMKVREIFGRPALATPEEASAAEEVTTPQAAYVKDICKRLRAGHQYSGIVDPLDMVAANLIEVLYLAALPALAAPPAAQIDGVREALEPFIKPMSRMAAAKMIDPTLGPMTPIDVVVTKHQFASAQIALSVTRPNSNTQAD